MNQLKNAKPSYELIILMHNNFLKPSLHQKHYVNFFKPYLSVSDLTAP